ncbi:MAG: hypothetical protein RMJ44_04215 [Cytophagales bacterium]|nr:hypothetical protein [Bernardetiaceae bacterium]MDW8210269.1 hypothetical protein [Cytophagales bacterium]
MQMGEGLHKRRNYLKTKLMLKHFPLLIGNALRQWLKVLKIEGILPTPSHLSNAKGSLLAIVGVFTDNVLLAIVRVFTNNVLYSRLEKQPDSTAASIFFVRGDMK